MYKEIETKPKKKRSTILRTVIVTFSFAGVFLLGIYIGNGSIHLGNGFNLNKGRSNKNLSANLDYSSVEAIYDALKKSYDGDLKEKDLLDGLKKGLVGAANDPYTEYMNQDEAKDFDNSLNGTFSGIGAELTKQDNAIVIVSPISGYPADKAGLKPKDVITEINGESAANLTVSEAVTKIRGPEGTKVKLKVVREGKQELTFEVTRQKITIPSVEYSVDKNNIGYLKISRFGEDTTSLAKKAADEFKSKNVKGVIVDVRSDPGGLLDAAVNVSSLWLDKSKVILKEKRGGQVVQTYKSKGGNILGGVPTVVLINGGSASASEITAGALHDNNAAILLGEKSFGKGSVQQVVPMDAGGVLKVTIARWYTPNDININKEGIKPDKEVKLNEDDAKNNRDPQKDAAIQYILNKQ